MTNFILERVSSILTTGTLVFTFFYRVPYVTLTWEKPDDSRVTGYKVYYGISGTDFKSIPAQAITSANQTSCLISDLEEGQTYDFTATSFDLDGNESDFFETINYLAGSLSDGRDFGYPLSSGFFLRRTGVDRWRPVSSGLQLKI